VKEEIARKPIVVRAVFQRRPVKAVTGEERLTIMRLQPTKGEAARRQAKGARGEARLLIPREAGCVASSTAGPPNMEDREASELLSSWVGQVGKKDWVTRLATRFGGVNSLVIEELINSVSCIESECDPSESPSHAGERDENYDERNKGYSECPVGRIHVGVTPYPINHVNQPADAS
jgi:hypothetical protein